LLIFTLPALAQRGGRAQQIPQMPDLTPRLPDWSSQKLHGTVLSLNLVMLVLLNDDRRVLEIEIPATARFTMNTEDGRPTGTTAAAVAPGDQVTVQSKLDPYARYHAEKIQLEMKGGDDEKKAAEETLEIAMGTSMSSAAFFAGSSADSMIEKARAAAVELTRSLPNFLVHQTTTRFTNGSSDAKAKGRKLDVVTGDLITEHGEERFQNMLINGKKPTSAPEKSGSWSSGEYSSIIIEVLAPRSRASFEAQGKVTVARRMAQKYSFSVDEAHSRWLLNLPGQRYLPAYTGHIWFDEETARVLRVEIASDSTPRGFPIEKVASTVEYDFVPLGDSQFLLPARAEVLNCFRGKALACSHNEIEFTGYRRFGAESTISFDKDPR
jgi:hypothetical protein